MLHKKGIFMTAAFAVPVLCCLIGIGAFVLLTTSMARPKLPLDTDMAQRIKEQENNDELKHEEVCAQVAQKIKEMIDTLGSAALNLQEDIPFLRRKLAEMQKSAQELDLLDTEINNTNYSEEDIQKSSENSRQQQVRLFNLANTNRNPAHREQEG